MRFARELAARASLAIENARAYERANEASRLKDEFLATLSHELRTPLNAVLGYARMMRTQTLSPEKASGAWDVVERNATSLKQIIEDVLDVSRIVAGRLRLNVEPVDLPGILRDAIATVTPAADARGVRVETVIEPLTAPVSGDADRLQQIVWNLLSNAIKFTPRGGKVQLRLSRVNSHVEVTVSDTGRGIAPDFLPFVFERFRQADATFTREHGGLGLGLAIAKQLAELHGGTITASSGGLDQGATFTVKLPLMIVHQPVPAEHQREHPHTERRAPELATIPRLDGIHVLAVDDEPDSLDLLRTVLEGAGATVSTARSGAEALDAIAPGRSRCPHRRRRNARDGWPSAHSRDSTDGRARAERAGRGAHGVRAIAGSDHVARQRVPHAPREADRPARTGRRCRDACATTARHVAARHGRASSNRTSLSWAWTHGVPPQLQRHRPLTIWPKNARADMNCLGHRRRLGSTIAEVVDRELKACLDHAAEGLHFVGPDGTILWANQTELDLLGYSREEYIGHNITEFHVDAPVIEDILARLTRGETLLNYEARLRRKDGSVRFVQINSNVLWRDDEFLHTRCFTRDITDRKAADELARRLADVVEHSEDAVISQDLDGRITSWNPAAERMYGHAAAEAIGQPIRLIIPPEREHEERDVVLRVRNGERVPTFETLRQHKTGALIDIALTVSPIRGRDGRVVGASKTARNIAARKRLEARDRFLVELDDLVRPLTDAEEITFTAARALGKHLGVNRCAYATVEEDEDTFLLTGNYNNGVGSIVGRYTFRQFGAECLRLMRAGEAYVVEDSDEDSRITQAERPSYEMTAIRAVICVPILKQGRFVAAMAVHSATTRTWRRDEVELVQRVASRCWESIERARVTSELRESEHLLPRAGEFDRQPRVDGATRRLDLLVQRPVVRLYRHHPCGHGRLGMGARPRSRRVTGGEETMAAIDRFGNAVRDGVPVARRRRSVSPIPHARQSCPGFARQCRPVVRDEHGRRERATRD